MQISFSDPFCRTISRHSAANPDPNQRCLFSEDPNNTNKICLKSNVDDGFWCPTKGWSKEPHSKKGVCNDNCEKENGKTWKSGFWIEGNYNHIFLDNDQNKITFNLR